MSFESFVRLYEDDMKPKLRLNTWLTKESVIRKKITPYFGKRTLSEITAKDVIRWQNEIRKMTVLAVRDVLLAKQQSSKKGQAHG